MMPGRSRGYKEQPRRQPKSSRDADPIPAPGGLRIVQELLNTVDRRSRTDGLSSPGDLAGWLSRQGLLPAGLELSAADLERALDVRTGLRALVRVHLGAESAPVPPDPEEAARLDRAALGARVQVRFDRDGTSRLDLLSGTFEDALGALLALVHMAQARDEWKALKLCAHPKCRRAFFDFTKSVTGKWCTSRCGNKIRALAYRRRRKAKGLD